MMKKICIRSFTVTAMILFLTAAGTMIFAQNKTAGSAGKQNDIKKLLVISGSNELGKQMMQQMIESFKGVLPNVPDNFWREFMNEADMDDLMNRMVPVYDKYLSHDDIKELVKFYESPAGKKYVKVLPQISKESMTIGQEWGEQVGEKVLKKLHDKGYK